jgi:sugar/nucleoside kinase (ribokinase family)
MSGVYQMRLDDRIQQSEQSYDVVTMGELLIDMVSTAYVPSLKEAEHFQKFPGGSSGNIAINLTKMGFRVAMIASVGNDDFGLYLVDNLREQGVNTVGIQFHPGHTSMVFSTKSQGNPMFLPIRHADLMLSYNEKQFELINQCRIFHFTSWTLSHPEIRHLTMSLLHHAYLQKKLITFDPNYREVLWEPNHNGKDFIINEVLPYVDIIKPSLDDAEHLWGQMTADAYESLFKKMEKPLVILTLGMEGAVAFDGRETYRVKSYANGVVNSTGAGDAFWSGLMAGLLHGNTIRKSLLQGSYTAAANLKSVSAVNDLTDTFSID